ncbi:MAG: adenylate/guanylate cyclase domain-containing protein [Microcoleus sp. PH2017_10_PVI_O_A]|uniref:adenylate/guanylate cyclase domain-containing protein n=1 Tax=unclassified Microcoleus TaxID=2642155 RepID=UPI001D838D72|nr:MULTISPECIES: adenylate/guanylate cyclase domain-containing protein [unclassified Microcoleus]TAE82574.1 MAG: adenylate/guanylate cyclase domain-containing protein [Oscillatoriales cyanobacterium]MCC3406664.1 adenylate/guanylate cyclase domain-containing protein [Microcoleus sp. PH2017_10_PVI_O_A]MCC3462108.1 adenylate/guanylate cyclase domain-containing protein [Microcoleus sp. PH2017_11_PCY_U_A]MCC3479223.1 adenylate/guanylate cyclase domain-containing protein [Microcoleus sp. PH2017_12_PC
MNPQINLAQSKSSEELNVQLQDLIQKLEEAEEEKHSYETLVDIITEHSTDLENQIHHKNREMQTYIHQVKKVIDAAIAVKNNSFEPQILSEVAARNDALGELAQVFSHMVQTVKAREQELEKLLQAYGRFVPDEYLQFLGKQSIVDFQLGDHVSKEMAIMFSDLRSFTTMAEQMTPQENFDFINTYLQQISPEIRKHNGFIVKYMGDGLMAVFPEGVDDAIQAGIVKFEQLQKFNQNRTINGEIPLNIGIGIHVGDTMVGIIGDANRMQADALSDHVNLTARLESLTKYYGVSLLISGEVVQRLSQPEKYHIRFLDRAIVKGRQEAITVCEVLDVEVEPVRSLKIQTLPIFEEGLEQYCQGNFANAQVCFEQIVALNPADKPSQIYLKRIQELLENSIPANWNGVWKFTQK